MPARHSVPTRNGWGLGMQKVVTTEELRAAALHVRFALNTTGFWVQAPVVITEVLRGPLTLVQHPSSPARLEFTLLQAYGASNNWGHQPHGPEGQYRNLTINRRHVTRPALTHALEKLTTRHAKEVRWSGIEGEDALQKPRLHISVSAEPDCDFVPPLPPLQPVQLMLAQPLPPPTDSGAPVYRCVAQVAVPGQGGAPWTVQRATLLRVGRRDHVEEWWQQSAEQFFSKNHPGAVVLEKYVEDPQGLRYHSAE